jgi:TrbL/VirB6 plasmid conjugal transfer protein/Transglycosylase-like domain
MARLSGPFAIALLLLASVTTRAQTMNPLGEIIEDESGGNPTITNPTSSASGLFQDTAATWAEALADCGCGTTAQYPSAASAPPSVQIAANAALIDQNGLSDWLCSGCDAAFATQVEANGGVGAYQTSGLSTSPAAYATADTDLSGALAALGATGGITVTEAGVTNNATGVTTAADGTTVTGFGAGALGSNLGPFTYLYNQFAGAVANPLENNLTAIQQLIQPYLGLLLVLMLIVIGIATMAGRMTASEMLYRAIRMSIVAAFLGVGSSYYNTYILQFFSGLPTTLSNAILGANTTNPAAGFDAIMHAFYIGVLNVWWQLPYGVTSVIVDGFLLGISTLIVLVFVALMFTVWMVAQVLLALLLTLGPLFFLALLFQYTDGWFYRWLNVLAAVVVATLAVDLLSSVIVGVILTYINTMPTAGGQASGATVGLIGVAGVVVVLSMTIAMLPRVLGFIAAAAGIPAMNGPQAVITRIGGLVTRGAAAALGAAAAI